MPHLATSSWLPATSSFSHLPIDWVILGVFAFLVIIISLRRGTQFASAIALSAPVAIFAFNAIPNTALISGVAGQFSSGAAGAALCGVLFIAFFLMTYRIMGAYGMTGAYPLQAVISGLAATIILLIFALQIPALSQFLHIGLQVQAVFAEKYRLFWLLGSYLALAFTHS